MTVELPVIHSAKTSSPMQLPPLNATSSIARKWKWYLNMLLINFVEFSAESSRGIILATLFLYSKSLGGDIQFMGLLTSVFSVGRFLSSLIFGWMCDRYTFKTVYILSSAICVVGNLCYLIADTHVASSLWLLAFSRFVVGFGAGNRSVCRANVTAITTVDQRLKYITILAMVVFLGYALTPGLGSLVVDVDIFVLGLHINKYTAPGVILMALNTITIVLMVLIYDESVGRDDGPPDTTKHKHEAQQLTGATSVPQRLVNIGVIVFIILNFNARGILSVFETVNIPLFLQATGHDPSSKVAVVEASNFQFYLGCIGLLSYFSIELFRHRVSDVTWLIAGFGALTIGNLILCVSPSTLSFWQLATGELFVWSIGCPITTAVVVATFSKILGGRPQGTLMGLLGSAASVSRIVLPVLPAMLSSFTPLFLIDAALCVFSVVALVYYNNLVTSWRTEMGESYEDSPLLKKPGSPRSPLHVVAQDFDERRS